MDEYSFQSILEIWMIICMVLGGILCIKGAGSIYDSYGLLSVFITMIIGMLVSFALGYLPHYLYKKGKLI